MNWHEEALAIDPEAESRRITEFIREQEGALNRSGAVLGLSGGLDSAAVAALAARALGPDKVLALIMPERDSLPESTRDAKALAKQLGIEWRVRRITPILRRVGTYSLYPLLAAIAPRFVRERFARDRQREIAEETGETPFLAGLRGGVVPELATGNAYYRSKHRIRMVLTYLHAERLNRLSLGCSNYTERSTGLFVVHGDDAGDVSPIMHLYKTQVFRLARHLALPRQIVEKAPSPDLVPGLTDEGVFGLPYAALDVALAGLEAGRADEVIASDAGGDASAVEKVRQMRERSEVMRRGSIWLER
jgi:NAD+ synthase